MPQDDNVGNQPSRSPCRQRNLPLRFRAANSSRSPAQTPPYSLRHGDGRPYRIRSCGRSSASPPQAPKKYPIGIELYAVRGELARDLPNTLRTVAQIGYEVVEFYAPYLGWTIPIRERRPHATRRPRPALLLDAQLLRCAHAGDTRAKAIEINQVLGARHIIMASPPPNTRVWKTGSA